mgnify:CR=1 FL=1
MLESIRKAAIQMVKQQLKVIDNNMHSLAGSGGGLTIKRSDIEDFL